MYDDRIRPSGTAEWFRLGGFPELAGYLHEQIERYRKTGDKKYYRAIFRLLAPAERRWAAALAEAVTAGADAVAASADLLRTAPGQVRNSSAMAPMPRVGVVRGSNAGWWPRAASAVTPPVRWRASRSAPPKRWR